MPVQTGVEGADGGLVVAELVELRRRVCLETGNYQELPNILLDCLYAFPYNIMRDEYSYRAVLHGIFLGMGVVPLSERRELSGTYDLAAICRGRACVFELKYNRSLREAQEQADRRQYGRSLLLELDRAEAAVCIALNVTKTRDGRGRNDRCTMPMRIGSRWIRSIIDVAARYPPMVDLSSMKRSVGLLDKQPV